MAITYSSGAGSTVTTAAMNETLGDQTQANGTDEVVVSDDFGTLDNGNVGSATYPGRLCIIREGAADEETRYITAETTGTGNTYILTVGEAWVDAPASGNTIHVSYLLDDVATLGGMSLISRTGTYEASNDLVVGDGTNFAYLAILNGEALEIVDTKSATTPGLLVKNNGRFDSGYMQAGLPIAGGMMFSINNADGEDGVEFASGAIVRWYDTLWRCSIKDLNLTIGDSATNDIIWRGVKCVQGLYATSLYESSFYDCSFLGGGSASEELYVEANTVLEDIALINSAGFDTKPSDTGAETLTLRDVLFVGNSPNISVQSNKTWEVINPVWTIDTSGQAELAFDSTTSNSVKEMYSVDATVQEPDGTALVGARVFVYEGTQNDDLELKLTTDSAGGVASSWRYKTYTDNSPGLTVVTYGAHAIRVFYYGRVPSVAPQTSNVAFDATVTMAVDGAVDEATAATAITAGSGISVTKHGTGETDTRPMKVLAYDAGVGTVPTVGETLTQGSATGVLVEYIGDAVSGYLVMDGWNGTEFTDNQNITGGTSSFDATTDTATFYEEYTWEWDGNSLTLQKNYDYQAARLAQSTVTAEFEAVHEWGQGNQALMIYSGASGYYTERSNSEGVWVTGRGTGTIAYMTADDGTQFIPPTEYTFELTGLKSNTEVRIYNSSTGAEVSGTESSGTSFSYNYTYGGDIACHVVIFHLNWLPIRLTGITLSNTDQSIPIQQQTDRAYYNP